MDGLGACFAGALGTCVIPSDIQYKMWYSPDSSNFVNLAFSNYSTNIKEIQNHADVETFALKQNYPNPFNPSTIFKYSIPTQSKVIIKVFDILGNEIETLVNEEKPVGEYESTWNAANLPSGVYFYQLKSGKFIQTKKMILLR